MERDPLLVLVALDGAGNARELRLELLAGGEQVEPVRVERGARLGVDLTELLAVRVRRQHRQLRLRPCGAGSPRP